MNDAGTQPPSTNPTHAMDTGNLVRMANRIGDFFAAMPDRAEALDGIATHIQKFWEPRMRRELLALLEADGCAGPDCLSEIVLTAVRANRARLAPAAA